MDKDTLHKYASELVILYENFSQLSDQEKGDLIGYVVGKYGNYMEKEPNIDDLSDVVFFTNRALQCEVRPNMRKISVEYIKDEKKFILYLFYARPLSQEELDYDVAGTILSEISSNFPNSIDIQWEDKIIILPCPSRLPNDGICIYRRYESFPSTDN